MARAMTSCLLLAFQVEGRQIVKVERLEKDGCLAPLQETFVRSGELFSAAVVRQVSRSQRVRSQMIDHTILRPS